MTDINTKIKELKVLNEKTKKISESIHKAATDQDHSKVPIKEYNPNDEIEAQLKNFDRKDAIFIKPVPGRSIRGNREHPLKAQEKERKRGWEYVVGTVENIEIKGEDLEFTLCKYVGDDDVLWRIPVNRVVAIPRHVAEHIQNTMKYVTYREEERKNIQNVPGEAVSELVPGEYVRRAVFYAKDVI